MRRGARRGLDGARRAARRRRERGRARLLFLLARARAQALRVDPRGAGRLWPREGRAAAQAAVRAAAPERSVAAAERRRHCPDPPLDVGARLRQWKFFARSAQNRLRDGDRRQGPGAQSRCAGKLSRRRPHRSSPFEVGRPVSECAARGASFLSRSRSHRAVSETPRCLSSSRHSAAHGHNSATRSTCRIPTRRRRNGRSARRRWRKWSRSSRCAASARAPHACVLSPLARMRALPSEVNGHSRARARARSLR